MTRRVLTGWTYACMRFSSRAAIAVLMLAALLVAACGGSGAAPGGTEGQATTAPDTPTREGRVAPTMPALNLAQPTTMIDATKLAEKQATPSAEVINVEFGAQVYERHCAECHGAAGEGVADKGEAVAGVEMDEAALATLLRTGGEYGPDHLFGIDKVSPDGIKALHAWMQTLPAPE